LIIIALTFSIRDMTAAEIQPSVRVKVWYSRTCEYLHGTVLGLAPYPDYYKVSLDNDKENFSSFHRLNLVKE